MPVPAFTMPIIVANPGGPMTEEDLVRFADTMRKHIGEQSRDFWRWYFAGQALNRATDTTDPDAIAQKAIQIADSMVKRLEGN